MSKADLPPGYYKTIAKMIAAGRSWFMVRPGVRLRLRKLNPRALYIGDLSEEKICWLSDDEDTRAFLRELDKASAQQATVFQALVVIDMLVGRGPPLEAS